MSHECKDVLVVAYGVETTVGAGSATRGVFGICTGGRVVVVGPSTVLVFVLGMVELWLLLKSGSQSPSYISFSRASTCLPELNLFSLVNSGLQCSTRSFRSSSLNPESPRLFSTQMSILPYPSNIMGT